LVVWSKKKRTRKEHLFCSCHSLVECLRRRKKKE
jgi:hypothetical protein